MLVLFLPALSNGVTAARFAFLGKIDERILLFIALLQVYLFNFTNLGGI